MNIGIIGTAGRKEDAALINASKYAQMLEVAKSLVADQQEPITLISGGAAVADHLAVQLALADPRYKLKLHLPARFDTAKHQFAEVPGNMYAPGNIANYYHRKFRASCGNNSLDELAQVIKDGAEVVVTPGFKERNTQVAVDSELLIAFTFGNGPVLKDGGTLDCMSKFLALGKTNSFHIDLHTMEVYSPAAITPPVIKLQNELPGL